MANFIAGKQKEWHDYMPFLFAYVFIVYIVNCNTVGGKSENVVMPVV